MLIKRLIFCDSETDFYETDIRLPFYRSFSTFQNIFDDLYTQVFYSWAWVRRGYIKSHLCCEIKSQNQNLYKTRNSPNLGIINLVQVNLLKNENLWQKSFSVNVGLVSKSCKNDIS